VISQHQQAIQLRAGQGLLVSNTRWLHGRDRYTGPRVMLRVLGDPLPGTGIQQGGASIRTPAIRGPTPRGLTRPDQESC
jgi:hypothetical protein